MRLYRISNTENYYVRTDYGYAFRSDRTEATTLATQIGFFDQQIKTVPDNTVYIVVDCDINDESVGLFRCVDKVEEAGRQIAVCVDRVEKNTEDITEIASQIDQTSSGIAQTEASLRQNIWVSPQIDMVCNSFFNTNQSFNKRDYTIIGNYLYLVNGWYLYKINLVNPDHPVVEGSIELTAIKNAYVLPKRLYKCN